jgi:lysophospholipase L1-like esterase
MQIPAADLLPDFRGEDETGLWLRPDDGHPNERGHALIARGIEGVLRRTGLATTATTAEPAAPDSAR